MWWCQPWRQMPTFHGQLSPDHPTTVSKAEPGNHQMHDPFLTVSRAKPVLENCNSMLFSFRIENDLTVQLEGDQLDPTSVLILHATSLAPSLTIANVEAPSDPATWHEFVNLKFILFHSSYIHFSVTVKLTPCQAPASQVVGPRLIERRVVLRVFWSRWSFW